MPVPLGDQPICDVVRLALTPCAWILCNFVGCCFCRKRKRVCINTTGTRELSPESESEPYEAERPCQAVCVGVMGDKGMRPLSPQGCGDEAQAQHTTLLFEDADVSDIGPPVDGGDPHVSMCAHHHQLYLATLPSRKCSQITCYRRAQSAKDGVPLCRKHLGILGEEANPVLGVFSGLRYVPHRSATPQLARPRTRSEEQPQQPATGRPQLSCWGHSVFQARARQRQPSWRS